MKNKDYLVTRLSELKTALVPQSMQYTTIHHSKIEILEWVYNEGNIKSQDEIENKILSIQEEITGLLRYQDTSYVLLGLKAQKTELENILN